MIATLDFTKQWRDVFFAIVNGKYETISSITEICNLPKKEVEDIANDLVNIGYVEETGGKFFPTQAGIVISDRIEDETKENI